MNTCFEKIIFLFGATVLAQKIWISYNTEITINAICNNNSYNILCTNVAHDVTDADAMYIFDEHQC